jgi:hypothetical protein
MFFIVNLIGQRVRKRFNNHCLIFFFLEEKPTEEDLEFMRQVCEELADASDVVVKRLNLPGEKVIHVIKFEEKPYVVRSEISALLWNSDILRTRVSFR